MALIANCSEGPRRDFACRPEPDKHNEYISPIALLQNRLWATVAVARRNAPTLIVRKAVVERVDGKLPRLVTTRLRHSRRPAEMS